MWFEWRYDGFRGRGKKLPIHYGVLTRDYSPWRSIKYGAAVGSRNMKKMRVGREKT